VRASFPGDARNRFLARETRHGSRTDQAGKRRFDLRRIAQHARGDVMCAPVGEQAMEGPVECWLWDSTSPPSPSSA
jgi:hypothetical protein